MKKRVLRLRPHLSYWFDQKKIIEEAIRAMGWSDFTQIRCNMGDPVFDIIFKEKVVDDTGSFTITYAIKLDTEKYLPQEYGEQLTKARKRIWGQIAQMANSKNSTDSQG